MSYARFLSSITRFMRRSEIRELLKLTEKGEIISLAGGLPDPKVFPIDDVSKASVKVLSEEGEKALQYAPTKGVGRYREELAKFIRRTRGFEVDPENIVVTTGSQQALDMIARVFIDPGDSIVVEEPTYLAALNAFRPARPRFVGVPVDDEGMKVEVLEEKLKELKREGVKPKFVYTIPIAQNPSGVTMSLERRKRLLELAEEYDFLVVEDDVYGLLVYRDDVDTTPLKAMDKHDRVIYVSSFSKILSPGFRLGHIIAPSELVNYFELCKQSMDLHTPAITQYITLELIRSGAIERNLMGIRSVYSEKLKIMLEAIEETFPKTVWYSRPVGGMFVWVKLNANIDTAELLKKAIKRGVAYVPGKAFYHDYSGVDTMRLNFTYPPKDKLRKAIEILGGLIKEEVFS
ncbi:MAG: aminotransferase [Thermoprotei archaeon]|nr:MAG: aminotransferase [Thermoprotei archaeon]